MFRRTGHAILRGLAHAYRWCGAFFHFDEAAVCELSQHLGYFDYHDYCDDVSGKPWHFVLLTCQRCGKRFVI